MNWKDLHKYSYTPYSNQPVYCLAEGQSGKFYSGVRIENISYPLTITAVQAAICHCLSEGDTPVNIISPLPSKHLENLEYFLNEFDAKFLNEVEVSESMIFDPVRSEAHNGFDTLKKLASGAVVPNSDFPVSAILETAGGYVSGVNIEFKSWTFGLCAERVAVAKAISCGIRDFKNMYVFAEQGEFSSPCGACRQVIIEHLPGSKIFLNHKDGSASEYFTIDLMPLHFKSNFLKKPKRGQ